MCRAHPDYDDFWEEFDSERVAHRVNVPVMFLGGWYDIFSAGTINSFMTIQKNGDEGALGKCRLAMEAYGHGRSDDLVFPDNARPKSADVSNWLDWFDIWMKNDGEGINEIPVVQYFVMGDPNDPDTPGNVWKAADDWPVPAKRKGRKGRISPFPFRRNDNPLPHSPLPPLLGGVGGLW